MEEEGCFWGLALEPGKDYVHVVKRAFHISMAALDGRKASSSAQGSTVLLLKVDKEEFVLCNLSHTHSQQPVDLNFTPRDKKLSFSVQGHGPVYLSGYLLDDDSLLSEEEEEALLADRKRKRPHVPSQDSDVKAEKAPRKIPIEVEDEDDSDDEDEDDEDEDEGCSDLDMLPYEDTDEDDELNDSDDEMDTEGEHWWLLNVENRSFAEEMSTLLVGKSKKAAQDKSQNSALKNKSALKKPTQDKHPQAKFSKSFDDAVAKSSKEAQSGQRSAKKNIFPNGDVSAKKNEIKKDVSTPSSHKNLPSDSAKALNKVMKKGGILSEDLAVGSGPEASSGKTVGIFYVGRLKSGGKEFDSLLGGKPLKFKLGKGDVIKGLDIGLEGMKVGGKRRLTIPPKMAYGAEEESDIPPNSTLVFEIELKSVN